jgi:hypothetical protein
MLFSNFVELTLIKKTTNSYRLVRRAKLILAAASGESNSSISRRLELDREQVRLWRQRWQEATERLFPTQGMKSKRVERIEFEYIRHGTLSLIANWHLAKGQVILPTLGAIRTEDDFQQHIARTIDSQPDAGWIFIVDNLNIHCSESLVRLVAKRCDIIDDLGVKGKSGILRSMTSRAAFLSDETDRIRFAYLPKHTSWLNQIECWFSILVRRLLKRSSFNSTLELKQKILHFIDYFNSTMAKPFI